MSINSVSYEYPEIPSEIRSIPTIGETVVLGSSSIWQTPNPELLAALKGLDPRIKYAPADPEKALSGTDGFQYQESVITGLASIVLRDFPGPIERTSQRGTVLSIRDEFPHYVTGRTCRIAKDGTDEDIRPPHTAPMLNVLTALRTGTDRGGRMGLVGTIALERGSPALYSNTAQYIKSHIEHAFQAEEGKEQYERADALFPVLFVYEQSRISTDRDGFLEDPDALNAIYITDRIIGSFRIRHDQLLKQRI